MPSPGLWLSVSLTRSAPFLCNLLLLPRRCAFFLLACSPYSPFLSFHSHPQRLRGFSCAGPGPGDFIFCVAASRGPVAEAVMRGRDEDDGGGNGASSQLAALGGSPQGPLRLTPLLES